MDIDFKRSIFEEPPDKLGEGEFHFGLLVLRMGGMEGVEVARAFAEAGDRLIDAALERRESWETAYPVLFCYRHALEIHLKALLPRRKKKSHALNVLWDDLLSIIGSHYRPDDLTWLGERIFEFHSIDPRSTAFRYHDIPPQGNPELWVDFEHLRQKVNLIFTALEKIRLAFYDRELL